MSGQWVIINLTNQTKGLIALNIKELLLNYQDLGFDIIKDEEQNAIIDFVDGNKEECPVALHRGLRVDCDYEIEAGEKISFKETFASFTEEEETAEKFTGCYGVIFELEDGEGLPIYMYTENHNETEWIIPQSEFSVEQVEKTETQEGFLIKVKIK